MEGWLIRSFRWRDREPMRVMDWCIAIAMVVTSFTIAWTDFTRWPTYPKAPAQQRISAPLVPARWVR